MHLGRATIVDIVVRAISANVGQEGMMAARCAPRPRLCAMTPYGQEIACESTCVRGTKRRPADRDGGAPLADPSAEDA